MRELTAADHTALRQGLAAAGADGWLLYDFQGHNPVANRFLALGGLGSRRLFVLLAPEQEPVAVAHKIELQPVADFPGADPFCLMNQTAPPATKARASTT